MIQKSGKKRRHLYYEFLCFKLDTKLLKYPELEKDDKSYIMRPLKLNSVNTELLSLTSLSPNKELFLFPGFSLPKSFQRDFLDLYFTYADLRTLLLTQPLMHHFQYQFETHNRYFIHISFFFCFLIPISLEKSEPSRANAIAKTNVPT